MSDPFNKSNYRGGHGGYGRSYGGREARGCGKERGRGRGRGRGRFGIRSEEVSFAA